MNKIKILAAGTLAFGLLAGATVAANAADKPAGNGKVNYTCWNGKAVTLDEATIKQKFNNHPMPGSAEHKLGMEKMKELKAITGVVTNDGNGHETVHIDDNNPAVQRVMKKYELKEYPQCQ
jgi:hypothetical protein